MSTWSVIQINGTWNVADAPTADSEHRIASGLSREQAVALAKRHNADVHALKSRIGRLHRTTVNAMNTPPEADGL